jgi:hypothetical protein
MLVIIMPQTFRFSQRGINPNLAQGPVPLVVLPPAFFAGVQELSEHTVALTIAFQSSAFYSRKIDIGGVPGISMPGKGQSANRQVLNSVRVQALDKLSHILA